MSQAIVHSRKAVIFECIVHFGLAASREDNQIRAKDKRGFGNFARFAVSRYLEYPPGATIGNIEWDITRSNHFAESNGGICQCACVFLRRP
jgi:hypothetical protein